MSIRIFTMYLAVALCFCCGSAPAADPVSAPVDRKPADNDASAVLDKMLAAYHNAKSYRDRAEILINIDTPLGKVPGAGSFGAALAFERPNRLRFDWQPPVTPDGQLSMRLLISDGKKVFTRSDSHPGQVVVMDAPADDVVKTLLASKEVGPLLTDGIVGGNLILQLLAGGLPASMDRSTAKLLAPAEHEGRKLDRVQFTVKDGNLTLWIDPTTSLVKRIEYPAAHLLEKLEFIGATTIEMFAEVKEAELDRPVAADLFTSTRAEGENFVRHFVAPPAGEPVAKSLGQPVVNFEFINSKGDKLNSTSLKDKVTVIDFWATWCEWCLKGMPDVEGVRKKYGDNDKVRFLALSEDEDEVTNKQIEELLKNIKVEVPWARLRGQTGDELRAKFEMSGIPALIVLGTDGKVQYQHIGYDPSLEGKLVEVIDALLAGQDLAGKAVAAREVEQREYQKRIEAAKVDPSPK